MALSNVTQIIVTMLAKEKVQRWSFSEVPSIWLLTSASLKFMLRMSQCGKHYVIWHCAPRNLRSRNTFLSYLHNLGNNVKSTQGERGSGLMAEAACVVWHKALHTILSSAMSERGTSSRILLLTLMKSAPWSSAPFSVASESIHITNVPTNCSRLHDQSHSLLMLWQTVVFIAEELRCRDVNPESNHVHVWDKTRRICSSSHSHANGEALSAAYNRPFFTTYRVINNSWS